MKKIFTICFIVLLASKIVLAQQIVHACCDTSVCSGTSVPLSVTVDAASLGSLLNILDDTYSQGINMGFQFYFFGTPHTHCVLSTNGYITFNMSNANQYSPWPIANSIPSSANPVNAIFGPWHDVDPAVSPYGSLGFGTFGTAPNRYFVFNFCSVPMYQCNDTLFTGQIILYEGSNNIEIHLTQKHICYTWNSGSAIEGVQNAAGTVAVVVPGRNYPAHWTAYNDAYRFTPSGASYTVSSIPYAPIPFSTSTPIWNTISGNYIDTGYNITVTPTTTTSYVVTEGLCGFSADTVTVTVCPVLPIQLLSFSGWNEGPVNQIKWITAAEYNSDYFDLERSIDGNNFKNIARVSAAGFSSGQLNYNFTDVNPNHGLNYYRLKLVDRDSSFTYSNIVLIQLSADGIVSTDVSFNPTINSINIQLQSIKDGEVLVQVTNILGMVVRTQKWNVVGGENLTNVNIGDLPPAMYFVNIYRSSSVRSETFKVLEGN